jgi:hypothetical protein
MKCLLAFYAVSARMDSSRIRANGMKWLLIVVLTGAVLFYLRFLRALHHDLKLWKKRMQNTRQALPDPPHLRLAIGNVLPRERTQLRN